MTEPAVLTVDEAAALLRISPWTVATMCREANRRGHRVIEYRLEGGPHDGRRVVTDGTRVLRMPVERPLNVLSMRRGPQLSVDIAEYERFGQVYRYERLIGDAWGDMSVSEEAFREPQVRRLVRQQVRRQFEGLDPDREVDAIVWRISRDDRAFTWRVRAFVGPTRVERGLGARNERLAAAADKLGEAMG